jgi:hypothetical protein
MHQEKTHQHREHMYVNAHILLANWQFGEVELWNSYQLGRVEFWTEVASILESAVCVGWMELQLFLSGSSVSADVLWCDFGTEGIRWCGIDEALLGMILVHPAPCYVQETEHLASSVLGPRCEVGHHVLGFLHCSAWTPSFGNICHINGQAHVGLFQLFPTSWPCHRSRDVPNLPEISCWLWQWDSDITSTI